MNPTDPQDAGAPRDPAAPDPFDRLDRALDGHPGHPGHPWPDPSLAETADRLRALAARAAPPEPFPAFIHHLEETLMRHAVATDRNTAIPQTARDGFHPSPEPAPPVSVSKRRRPLNPGVTSGATPPTDRVVRLAPMNGHHPAAPIPSASRLASIRSPRRLSAGALATAAAVVLLLGGIAYGGWLASSPGDDGGGPEGFGAAQEATAVEARPVLCALASTEPTGGTVSDETPRPLLVFPPEAPIYEVNLPTGPDASDETTAAIEATVREIAVCGVEFHYRAPDADATPAPNERADLVLLRPTGGTMSVLGTLGSLDSLYSDAYLRRIRSRMAAMGTAELPVWKPETTDSVIVRDARTFDDGRIGAIVEEPSGRTFVVFVEEDGRWLVDETWVVSEPVVTPEAAALDYCVATQFAVNLRAEPNGDSAIVDVVAPRRRLQSLGEQVPTADPAKDGPSWLKFRTSAGSVGWLREIDVSPVPSGCPAASATWSMVPTTAIDPTFPADPTTASDPTATVAPSSDPTTTALLATCAVAPTVSAESESESMDPTIAPETWTMVPTHPGEAPSTPATVTAITASLAATAPTDAASRFAFVPTHQSNPGTSINLRAEPSTSGGAATIVTVLPPATPLMFLGETAPSEDPAQDGDRWLLVQVADGATGWLRQIDAEPAGNDGS